MSLSTNNEVCLWWLEGTLQRLRSEGQKEVVRVLLARITPTRGGGSCRRAAGRTSEATGKRTGELLVAHPGGLPPETFHQTQLLECEVVAEPRERAFEIPPRLLQKGRFRCGPPCQVTQYVFAHDYLPNY